MASKVMASDGVTVTVLVVRSGTAAGYIMGVTLAQP